MFGTMKRGLGSVALAAAILSASPTATLAQDVRIGAMREGSA